MLTRLKAHYAIADHGSRTLIEPEIRRLDVPARFLFLKKSSVFRRNHRILRRRAAFQWAPSGIIGGASCNLDLKGVDTHTFSFRVQSARFSLHRPNL
jgi:hypothetical protein